jgi:biopolymer transport protein ExbB
MVRNERTRRRLIWIVVLALLGFWAVTVPQTVVRAQDESPAAKEAAAEEPAPPARENFLVYIFKASPIFFFIMFALSCYLVTMVIQGMGKLRMPNVIPPTVIASLDTMLSEKKFKEAYELVRNDQSLFGRSLTAGVERLSHGFDRGMEAMITVAEDGKMDMEHKVSPVATIGSVAPMLGLMGTVIGMILAFQQIAAGGQPRPAELAKNIGLALVTTLEGIVIAVPAIYCFALLRNRIARLVFEVETVGESYLWRFAGALKK